MMGKALAYCRAQLRRTVRIAPMVLAFLVLLTAVLSVILLKTFAADEAKAEKQPIRIGVVGDLTDTYLEAGLFALQNMDSSQFYLEFVTLTEEAAADALKAGELTAYLRIPDNFVQDMLWGKDTDVTFVAGNSPSALGPLLMREVAEVVSDIIIHAQKGVYGYMAIAEERLADATQRYALVEKLSIRYATEIFGRGELYRQEILGISHGLPLKEYYLCAGFLLVVLLCGVVCAPLLIKSDLALPRLLHTTGLTSPGQIAGEFLPFFLLQSVCGAVLLTAVGAVLSATTDTLGILPEWTSVTAYLQLAVQALPVILLLSAWQFLLYELAAGLIGGVLLQVLMTVSLAYASGFLLPLSALPPSLQAVSAYLPTGLGFRYLTGVVGETGSAWVGFAVVGYALVLLVAAMLVRKRRIGGAADDA